MTTALTFTAEFALCYGTLCGLAALLELAIRR